LSESFFAILTIKQISSIKQMMMMLFQLLLVISDDERMNNVLGRQPEPGDKRTPCLKSVTQRQTKCNKQNKHTNRQMDGFDIKA
jgi:hypothetical protein